MASKSKLFLDVKFIPQQIKASLSKEKETHYYYDLLIRNRKTTTFVKAALYTKQEQAPLLIIQLRQDRLSCLPLLTF